MTTMTVTKTTVQQMQKRIYELEAFVQDIYRRLDAEYNPKPIKGVKFVNKQHVGQAFKVAIQQAGIPIDTVEPITIDTLQTMMGNILGEEGLSHELIAMREE